MRVCSCRFSFPDRDRFGGKAWQTEIVKFAASAADNDYAM
jgi:hypothetical protein